MQRIFFLFSMMLISSGAVFGVETADIKGKWTRTYTVYRAWMDDNQGTISYYQEELAFDGKKTVQISTDVATKDDAVWYTVLQKKEGSFLVIYMSNQDPNDADVQKNQGYFISLEKDDKNQDILVMVPDTKFFSKNGRKKNAIIYTRETVEKENIADIIPKVNPN